MGRNLLVLLVVVAAVAAYLKFDWLSNEWRQYAGSQVPAGQLHPWAITSPSAAIPALSSPPPPAASTSGGLASVPALGNPPATVTVPPDATQKAPPGYLYVLHRITKVTDSGVMAVDAGAKVALLSRGPMTTKVTDGTADYDVENEYLTDETDVAEMAQRTDPESQAALAAWLEHHKAASLSAGANSRPRGTNN